MPADREEAHASGEPLLGGATVQKVDVASDLAVLRVRSPGATFHLIVAAGRAGASLGITRWRPLKGGAIFSAPEHERRRWRTKLEGAKVVGIEERRAIFFKEGAALVIEASPLRDGQVTLREAGAEEAAGEAFARAEDEAAWLARGEELARRFGEAALTARRQELTRALGRAVARIERRMEAVQKDLARIAEADGIAAQASAFVAAASRAPRGARSITVTDWSSGEAKELTLPLDPSKSAREQIDAMFKRARRLKQGAVIARQRLADAEAAWEKVTALAEEAGRAEGFEALETIAKAARAAAPRDFALGSAAGGGAKAAKARASLPYRAFLAGSGERILVGRGAAHNDALTLKVGRPHDLWLHAKGRTGAHVIVPLEKNRDATSEVLIDAAHLAAHFSDAREEGVVEIQYTPRRYLRKPKGSAPGFVIVDREKVLVLRVEKERIARLLAAEEIG